MTIIHQTLGDTMNAWVCALAACIMAATVSDAQV